MVAEEEENTSIECNSKFRFKIDPVVIRNSKKELIIR